MPVPPPGEIAASVFLIGDAGAPDSTGEPVLVALRQLLMEGAESTVVVFLGDNVYPRGLPVETAKNRSDAERRLAAQVEATELANIRTIFVPGNHDWEKSGSEGLAAIRRQGEFLTVTYAGRVRLLPERGCPGPAVQEVAGAFRLVLLDTEWWLHPGVVPGSTDGCEPGSQPAVLVALGEAIAGANGLPVIVAAHHPLESGGEHGGHFAVGDHLFPLRNVNSALWIPLPIIGSLYPLIRGRGVSSEDMRSGRYKRLRAAFDSVFACHPPTLYAAGHEHALQVIDRGRPPLLAVSGAGIFGHEGHVTEIPGSRLALSAPGFMRVDRLRDGRVRLGVVVVERSGLSREVFSEWVSLAKEGGTGKR